MMDHWRTRPALVPRQLRDTLCEVLNARMRTTNGIQRLALAAGRISLTLVFGDAAEWLPTLSFRADAWLLDAYEPAVESVLWSDRVLSLVAQRSRRGTVATTFSAARVVRERLTSAGFSVERLPGFATKRHMTRGVYERDPSPPALPAWFRPPAPTNPTHAMVYGGGLAAAWCARTLADRGLRVRLCAPDGIGRHGSAVPLAAAPQPDGSWNSEQVRILDAAWHLLRARAHELGLPYRETDACVGPDRSSAEHTEHAAAACVRRALLLSPGDWITRLLTHASITVDESPRSDMERGTCVAGSDAAARTLIVEARAFAAGRSGTVCDLGAPTPTRGQITRCRLNSPLKYAIMDGGFVLPLEDPMEAWAGPANRPGDASTARAAQDRMANTEVCARLTGAACAPREDWAGVRASSPDHLPLIGPIARTDRFAAQYQRLCDGPLAVDWPDCDYERNRWCSIGHGSHGALTAPLGAELIADFVFGTPHCLADELLPYLMPQRFAVRALRRGTDLLTGGGAWTEPSPSPR